MLPAINLAACSYGHGVIRILTFDRDVSDLICLKNQLEDLGYRVIKDNESISYQPQSTGAYPSPILSISHGKVSNGDGTYELNTYTLEHRASFGSGPTKCNIVNSAAKNLKDIENQILTACDLTQVKKPEERVSCG
jgi:hypothetical protein